MNASSNLIDGRFEPLSVLGKGCVAVVHLAMDHANERRAVALKVPYLRSIMNSRTMEGFAHEALLLKELDHPQIPRHVAGRGSLDNAYIAMEWIDGKSLSRSMDRACVVSDPLKVVRYFLDELLSVVHHIHGEGIIHRDLKLESFIRTSQAPRTVLIDFGFASSRHALFNLHRSGTPGISSPEQMAGGEPVPRNDVYSLGVILYELLSNGYHPSGIGDSRNLFQWDGRTIVPLQRYTPHAPEPLSHVIECCLTEDIRFRYESVDELEQALRDLLRT